jgi:transposase
MSSPPSPAVTARTLIAELPELARLDPKRVASLAGLAPYTRQFGQWKGKGMIGGGRKSMRSVLFLAALVASRYNPSLETFRDRLVKTGKPKMVAIIATARKLLTILNAILRDQKPWQGQSENEKQAHAKAKSLSGDFMQDYIVFVT